MAMNFVNIPQLLKSLLNATKLPQTDAIMRDDMDADLMAIIGAVRQVLGAVSQNATGNPEEDAQIAAMALQQIAQVVMQGVPNDGGMAEDEGVSGGTAPAGLPTGGGIQPA
jgi:hypothetical protein